MTEDYNVPDATEPEDRDRDAQQRLEAVARAINTGVENLQVLHEGVGRLAHLGTEARFYKVYDTATRNTAGVAIDETGRAVDADDLLGQDDAARRERYGVLQPALSDLLDQLDPDRRVPVMLRYAIEEDPVPIDKREIDVAASDDAAMTQLGQQAASLEAQVAERARQLHREVMSDVDTELSQEEPLTSGPFVRAVLSPEGIRRLANDERLVFIGLDGEREIPDYPNIPDSLPTTRTEIVQSTGVRGAGVRIAVLESGCPNVSVSCFNIGATQDLTQPANDHMTKSIGIIGNRYSAGSCGGSWQGYAPDATVLLANDTSYQDRYDWARGENVNVVTMSWHFGTEETNGNLHSRDVYFDYWVTRWPYPSVFTSAGNEADDAFASGKGYNFMGVGNVLNDGDGDRCNDVISSTSSWKNPTSTHGDHEVPAVAAPGSRHELLGSSFGGTSCATPVTASISALLMSKNPSLTIWPEAIRAILLATANYQRADAADYSRFADGKDGAGLVNALYGMWTAGRRDSGTGAQFRAHDYGLATAGDFSGGYFGRTWTARTLTTSSRIRVALAWNSKTAASGGTPSSSVLDADLDLHVFDPNGNLVAWGNSWDNSWEFLEFTPSMPGNYMIKVHGFSVPSDFSSWYGVAWTTHYDLC
jgi:serine protease AprX